MLQWKTYRLAGSEGSARDPNDSAGFSYGCRTEGQLEQTQAILTPITGYVAIPRAREAPRPALDLDLRQGAIHADGLSLTDAPLAPIWNELLSGALRVAATFSNDERHYAVFAPSDSNIRRPPAATFLERVLLGDRQKVMAFDQHLALPALSTRLGHCLKWLGVDRRTSHVPLFLALLAQASQAQSAIAVGRMSRFQRYSVLSIARPDRMLAGLLSPAESAVARLLVDGNTHAEIAVMRCVSRRTVANQLASAFRKLGVSCRFELICYLLRRSGAEVDSTSLASG